MNATLRSLYVGASLAALSVVAGCSNPELVDNAPPPHAEVAPPRPAAPQPYVAPAPSGRVETTELLGGPAPAPRPAPAPQPAPRTQMAPGYSAPVVTMAPIPNPGTRAAPAPVYAERTPAPSRPRVERAPRVTSSRPVPNPYVASEPKMAPAPKLANPSGVAKPNAIARPALPAAKPATPAPKLAAPAPKPAAPAPAPAPAPKVAAKPAAPAPKPVPAPVAKPAAPAPAAKPAAPAPTAKAPVEKPKTKLEQLGIAVAGDITGGSKLAVPPELAAGKQGVVSLTLAPALSERIQAEAAKLGLTREARTVDARATLSGDGYTVIPSASQSARLKAGEATTFNWQVTPVDGEKGPLKAEVSGELKGSLKPQSFPIASVEQALPAAPVAEKKGFKFELPAFLKPKAATEAVEPDTAPAAEGAPAPAGNAMGPAFADKLAIPGAPASIDVPSVGPVKTGLFVLVGLGVLALLILMGISGRIASKRRAAARRRKFRTMTEFHSSDDYGSSNHHHEEPAHAAHHEPETVHVHHDEPEVHHDDHGHGHGHDEHKHEHA